METLSYQSRGIRQKNKKISATIKRREKQRVKRVISITRKAHFLFFFIFRIILLLPFITVVYYYLLLSIKFYYGMKFII